ncbi:FeS cluster assembly protein SufB [archaeon HR06]|nr:FeS cluster assembly protein SufB [archaeon HR06]
MEELVRSLSKEKEEPDWLLEDRLKSLKLYKELPLETSPLYTKYVDPSIENIENLEPLKETKERSFERFEEDIPSVILVNGKIKEKNMPKELLEEGLILEDLWTTLKKYEDLFKEAFKERVIKPEEDKFSALCYALMNGGLFLYVPKGLEINVPIRIMNYLYDKDNFHLKIYYIDEGSKLNLVEENYSLDGKIRIASEVTNIILKDNSNFSFSSLQNYQENFIALYNRRSYIGRDANMNWILGFFGSKFTRSRVDSYLAGVGSQTEDMEMVFGSEEQRFDITSDLTHRGSYSKGVILARGVLRDKARCIFKGMINIAQQAKNSEAYLAEHAMLLNKGCRADAIPGLEIQTNEVRATHSASVAQIDEEQIFYLMCRGLSELEAKKIIVHGFFQPALEKISLIKVRRRIRELIERKWGGMIDPALMEEDIPEVEAKIGIEELFSRHYKYRR